MPKQIAVRVFPNSYDNDHFSELQSKLEAGYFVRAITPISAPMRGEVDGAIALIYILEWPEQINEQVVN